MSPYPPPTRRSRPRRDPAGAQRPRLQLTPDQPPDAAPDLERDPRHHPGNGRPKVGASHSTSRLFATLTPRRAVRGPQSGAVGARFGPDPRRSAPSARFHAAIRATDRRGRTHFAPRRPLWAPRGHTSPGPGTARSSTPMPISAETGAEPTSDRQLTEVGREPGARQPGTSSQSRSPESVPAPPPPSPRR